MKSYLKWGLFLLGFIGFILLMNLLPFREWMQPVLSVLDQMGWKGKVLYVLLGILLTLLFVPVSILISLTGFFFGLGWGMLISLGILAGGTLVGNTLGGHLWPKIKHAEAFQNPIFRAVRQVLKESGLWIVALLRMTPFLHFMTGNLFLGSLKLRVVPYMGYSLLGMIPGTLLVVIAGDVARQSVEQQINLTGWRVALFALGGIIFVCISTYITRKTRTILDQHRKEAANS